MSRWRSSRSDEVDTDPLISVANLVDLRLVFICGLLAQLKAERQPMAVERGRELPRLPESLEGAAG